MFGHDCMNMIGHSAKSEEEVVAFFDSLSDAPSDCPGLDAVQPDRRVPECLLGGLTLSVIVRDFRKRKGLVGFGGVAERQEATIPDIVAPRTSRIVRQPEAVAPEREVGGDHGRFFRGLLSPEERRASPTANRLTALVKPNAL